MVKVLVVDDNRAVLATTVLFLQSKGLDVTGVDSAAQALSLYQMSAFDVVVTDYLMPEQDGLELAGALLEIGSRPRLILITGLALTPPLEAVVREHFDTALVKPFRLEKLAAAILANEDTAQS